MPNQKHNAKPRCHNVGGRVVCGFLAGGGRPHKKGHFMLHKNETVFSPAQMKQLKSAGKKNPAKKTSAGNGRKKKCSCKH